MNDPRVNPFVNYNEGQCIHDDNVKFEEVVWDGWPHLFVLTTQGIYIF